MADGSIKIDVDVGIKQAEEKLKLLKQEAEKSGDSLSESMSIDVSKMESQFERAKLSIDQTNTKIDDLKKNLSDISTMETDLNFQMGEQGRLRQEAIALNHALKSGEITLEQFNERLEDIENQMELSKMAAEGMRAALSMTSAENIVHQLQKQELSLERQNIQYEILGMNADKLRSKIAGSNTDMTNLDKETKKTESSLKSASNSASNMGDSIGKGVKKLAKYALALFSIRSAYRVLSRLSNQWLQSDNAGARQVRANIEAMSNALSNALAPVITWITNAMATLFGYVNAVLKAFFGIDLMAKSTAKNTGGIASGTKKARKEAEKFSSAFDKADIATSNINDNLDSGGGGGSGMDLPAPKIPTPDISGIKKLFDKVLKDFDPFIKTLKSVNWNPMIDSLKRLGNAGKESLGIIYDSFVRTTNNAIGPFFKLMAEDLHPKAINAISDAVERMNPYLDYLLKNIVEPLTAWFLLEFTPATYNLFIDAFALLTAVVEKLLDKLIEWYEYFKPAIQWIGDVAVGFIEGLSESIKELTDKIEKNEDGFGDLVKTIGTVIAFILVAKASMALIGFATLGLTKIIAPLVGIFTKLWGIIKIVAAFFAGAFTGSILAIIALVALIGLAIVGLITNFEQVKKDFFNIIGNIKGMFKGLIDFIVGVFTGNWKKAFKGLADAVINAFAGIANIVKFPINLIVDGVNAMIRGLNRIKIPNWVPGVGGLGINLPTIPRLARGTYATSGAMAGIFGENGREAVVPLENNTGWVNDFMKVLNEKGGFNGGGGTTTTNLVVDGMVLATVTENAKDKRNLLMNGAWA